MPGQVELCPAGLAIFTLFASFVPGRERVRAKLLFLLYASPGRARLKARAYTVGRAFGRMEPSLGLFFRAIFLARINFLLSLETRYIASSTSLLQRALNHRFDDSNRSWAMKYDHNSPMLVVAQLSPRKML